MYKWKERPSFIRSTRFIVVCGFWSVVALVVMFVMGGSLISICRLVAV